MINTCGELKRKIEAHTDKEHSLHVINAHIVTSHIPPQEERLASDVSVDPFGDFTRNILPQQNDSASRIWTNKEFMKRFWQSYWEPQIGAAILDPSGRGTTLQVLLKDDKLCEAVNREVDERLVGTSTPMQFKPQLGDVWTEEELEKLSGPQGVKTKLQFVNVSAVYSQVKDLVADVFAANPAVFASMKNVYFSDDDLMKESFIYWQIMPRWMPHADAEHTYIDENGEEKTETYPEVVELWKNITKSTATDPVKAEKELQKMRKSGNEDRVVSAVAAAYIWGHFTQYVGPGQDKTLVQHLHDEGIQLSFEAHFASQDRDLRMWIPHDMLYTSKIINNTPVKTVEGGKKPFDVIRVTVDCEHLATQRVDPVDVIVGQGEYKDLGIPEELGHLIRMQHVTHPYVTEGGRGSGHSHGPIQFGDLQVFEYTYRLVEKGFCKNPDEFAVVMYEIGGEKTPTIYLLRLIMRMIELGITFDDLENVDIPTLISQDIDKLDISKKEKLKRYLMQQFFGISDREYQDEWANIYKHAADPLQGLLEWEDPTHGWRGRAALERRVSPEDWAKEEYQ